MKLQVKQRKQINFKAQYTCELQCKKKMRKMDYMMPDWLSHTGHKEITFKGHHDIQPSSALKTLYISEIWAYPYTLPQTDIFTLGNQRVLLQTRNFTYK